MADLGEIYEYKVGILEALEFPKKFIDLVSDPSDNSERNYFVWNGEGELINIHFPFYWGKKFMLSLSKIEETNEYDFPEMFKESPIYEIKELGFSCYDELYDKLFELKTFLEIIH